MADATASEPSPPSAEEWQTLDEEVAALEKIMYPGALRAPIDLQLAKCLRIFARLMARELRAR